jgi:hypothetical protein
VRGIRGALGVAIGLAMMQLVLSSSQGGGKTGSLLAAGFQIPADVVRAFIDPKTPAIQDRSGTPARFGSYSGGSAGLSGTASPAGTGSSLISV